MAKAKGIPVNELVKIILAERFAKGEGGAPSDAEVKAAIRLGFAADFWQEYAELKKKRQAEALNEGEQARLIELSDKVETANSHRMAYLSLLAELQNIPLETLVQKHARGLLPYV